MDPYIGEIRIFAGMFAPKNWAICDGQLIAISQNTALFSVLGIKYGGDGENTFALPDLRDRVPMHWGAGPGLTPRQIGDIGGESRVTLTQLEMPRHGHTANASDSTDQPSPGGAVWGSPGGRSDPSMYNQEPDTNMNPQALQMAGGNQSHNNMQPYLGLNFIISLYGNYPSKK